MKKLVLFFIGVLIVGLVGGAIYVAGAIFDAGRAQTIQPYFFQPNNISERRPGVPMTATDMGDAEFLELLVKKYITEYFYAAPDAENIARRQRPNSALARMSAPSVFDNWTQTEAQTIQKLADEKSLRTAHVIDKIYKPQNSQYWVVNYQLTTWEKPNDFDTQPVVQRGTMYMDITYAPQMRTYPGIDVLHKYLESGGDPAAVFMFTVNEIQGL